MRAKLTSVGAVTRDAGEVLDALRAVVLGAVAEFEDEIARTDVRERGRDAA